ncbi:hypothetical protein LOK49_LG06G02884 [Camellia lanceoleosa]|uniref:Uncharacterized protein n=1 Tax=Camellia lanceoleosa TaxID=1840588 RepID=A0ACC0HDX1_9ERIC|nr:hypothetical protein LOK49_LG06G02884 [Camellia lanceoleosa]
MVVTPPPAKEEFVEVALDLQDDDTIVLRSVELATILNIDREFAFFRGANTPPTSASASAFGSQSPTMRQWSGLCFGRSSSPSTESSSRSHPLGTFSYHHMELTLNCFMMQQEEKLVVAEIQW